MNTNALVSFNATDPSGNELEYIFPKLPLHGILKQLIEEGKKIGFIYKPHANYKGSDSFNYQVKDANGWFSNIAKVNILIEE